MSAKRQKSPSARKLAAMQLPEKRQLSRAGLLAVLSGLVWIAQAAIAADTLGALASGTTAHLPIWPAAALFLALGLLRNAGDALAGRIAFNAAQSVIARQRRTLIDMESRVSPFDPDRLSSAETATLLAGKLDLLTPYLTRYRTAYIKVMILPFAILFAVFCLSWTAGIILMIAGPLIPVFMALIGISAGKASERHMVETGALNAMLLERLNALADIKLLNAGKATVSRFEEVADELRRRTMAVLRIAFLSSTVLELFSAIGIAMVAIYIGFSLLGTFSFGVYGTPLSIGGGIFILLLAPDFFQPLRELASAWHDKAAAVAVAGELLQRDEAPVHTILGSGRAIVPLEGNLTIETRGLASQPVSGQTILYPDLRIEPGDSIAITGPSGVGKSTLLALIAGLTQPQDGHVRIGGSDLAEDNADAWRGHLAWVGQNPHFLNASLRANVAMTDSGFDDKRVSAAIDAAFAGDVVATLPRGFDTRLGETGSGISGGEARRIMLARAFHSGAKVVLADEPTADLDRETADQVSRSLLSLVARGVTLIVATHDPRLAGMMGRQIHLGAVQ